MPKKEEHSVSAGSFWSGAITFGLVSIQVDLYSAHRHKAATLRMVDSEGTPLQRRYFCPQEHRPLTGDEIVRGYEIEDGRYITVSDKELEALEPKKSREIDLRSFVDLAELDPVYFEHAYYLLPAGGVNKPYRLLAEIMERNGRAGVATFVMREREHLVAIISEGGIMRAEILRFADEIRTPDAIGLPPLEKPDAAMAKKLQQEIKKRFSEKFKPDLLHDRYAQGLLDLVRRKLKSGEDVREKPEEAPEESAEVIDLMEIIKKRFKQAAGAKKTGAGQINSRRKKG